MDYKLEDFEDYVDGMEYIDYPEWYINKMNELKGHFCISCGKKLFETKNFRYDICPPNNSEWIWEREYLSKCYHDYKHAIHDRKTSKLIKYIHKRDGFVCSKTNKKIVKTTKCGIELPIFNGHVVFIKPLEQGGRMLLSNLQLVY